ncbi:serine carboxypeptidase 24-like [Cryptomeria japonica]|uniref:serine carboxypeptidase 24-like n=1 Tax=Cryptomeria japonica TaxID=3369 RepID=UPI0027DA3A72|nr:serine carboxypeptidase 24-like [Cryptomeria japonica]
MDGLYGFDPCSPGYVITYLNTHEVQRALHANVTSLPFVWDMCSGDVDLVVPMTGTRYSINALKLSIETKWYPWMNGDIDVGGYSVIYKGLIFATNKAAAVLLHCLLRIDIACKLFNLNCSFRPALNHIHNILNLENVNQFLLLLSPSEFHHPFKMKNIITLLLIFPFALLVDPSHQRSQQQVLSEFLERKRSAVESPTHEWTAPSVNFDHIYPQDGLQENDKITSLPGQPSNVTFAQYSGYVTVDAQAGRALFYYFAEATQDPTTKPLLLWLNGGPGCSSFGVGAMTELGPFRVQPDNATLSSNPYAWNQVANTLFLESPAGVGFSYSNTSDDYKNGTDENTAVDSYTFLLNWFERFPQYKNREFYIAGESYAGFYIPELADTILKNNYSRTSFLNLKGVMIGNGLMNDETDDCGVVDYAWSHALMSDEEYEYKRCKGSNSSFRSNSDTFHFKFKLTKVINPYNIYAPLCPSHPDPIWTLSTTTGVMSMEGLYGFDPCSPSYVLTYLNTHEVQRALHANVTSLPFAWDMCSDVLWYGTYATTMLPIYRRMIASGVRILVYSGDVDSIVPVTGTRYSINALNLPIETKWYPWMNGDIDVGGYSVIYKGLIFATVRGAGHQVPSYQPSRALTMTKSFLAGQPLPS